MLIMVGISAHLQLDMRFQLQRNHTHMQEAILIDATHYSSNLALWNRSNDILAHKERKRNRGGDIDNCIYFLETASFLQKNFWSKIDRMIVKSVPKIFTGSNFIHATHKIDAHERWETNFVLIFICHQCTKS